MGGPICGHSSMDNGSIYLRSLRIREKDLYRSDLGHEARSVSVPDSLPPVLGSGTVPRRTCFVGCGGWGEL